MVTDAGSGIPRVIRFMREKLGSEPRFSVENQEFVRLQSSAFVAVYRNHSPPESLGEGTLGQPVTFTNLRYLLGREQTMSAPVLIMMVSHEGWEPRTSRSDEYELVNKSHYPEVEQAEDFWDNASRHLYSIYDIDEEMLVVINGDRAKWIRKGVEYFPNAIYQVDRYHLKREVGDLLRDTRHLKEGLAAVDGSDVQGLTEALRKARMEVQDPVRVAKIDDLLSAIREMPEAFRDYRVRLAEMGYDIRGMRGMGATESNVNKFSLRLKKRGQSWGPEGLKAMLHSMVKYFEGKLDRYAEHVSRLHNLLNDEKVAETTKEIVSRVTTDIYEAKRGGMPLLGAGTSRSGGLSRVLRHIALPDPAIN